MASSSTSGHNFLRQQASDPYQACFETLSLCKKIQFKPHEDTPLYRCLYLIWNGHLTCESFPAQSFEHLPPLYFSEMCKARMWESLTTKIRVGRSEVDPISWFCNLMKLSVNKNWIWWDSALNGSARSTSKKYWSEQIRRCAPNLDSQMREVYCQRLTRQQPWRNLDSVIRVQLGNSSNAREVFEAAVWEALLNAVNENLRANDQPEMGSRELYFAIKPYTHIEGEGKRAQGTIYTINDGERSFDLTVWYLKYEEGLPEIYTQQGYSEPCHDLICLQAQVFPHNQLAWPFKQWPYKYVRYEGVYQNVFLVDSIVDIIRGYPRNDIKFESNFGLFKRLLVMMTKGSLCPQTDLKSWAWKIYRRARNTPQLAAYDAWQSYRDHLPQTLGALLAHRLHWIAEMQERTDTKSRQANGASNEKIRDKKIQKAQLAIISLKELVKKLEFPMTEDVPEHLKQIYFFLKKYPLCLPMLLTVLDFVMLLGYLKNCGQSVTCGMLEGKFTLRLRLDNTSGSYFQRRLEPKEILRKIHLFLTAESDKPKAHAAAKSILFKCLEHFDLKKGFEGDSEALKLLRNLEFNDESFQVVWFLLNESLPAPATPQSEEKEPAESILESVEEDPQLILSTPLEEVQQPKLVPIPELIANHDWHGVVERLIHIGKTRKKISEENIPRFGEYVWELFRVWSSQWRQTPPSQEQRRCMRWFLQRFLIPLQWTSNEERSIILRNLISDGFKGERQLRFLLNHEEKEMGLLSRTHLTELLMPWIAKSPDCASLLRFHRILPAAVHEYVSSCLNQRPLPEQKKLSMFISFLRVADGEQFALFEDSLGRQIIYERRSGELAEYHFSADPLRIFESIFTEHLQNVDFTNAREILGEWRRYSDLPLRDQELQLLTSEANHSPLLTTVQEVLKLWQKQKAANDENVIQSLSLCFDLATKPLHIDAPTMKALWNILKKNMEPYLKELTIENWQFLLGNIQVSKNHNELWEALDKFIDSKDYWNPFFETILEQLLKKSLKKQGKNRARGARTDHLLKIVVKLEKHVRWNDKMSRLTPLVLKNIAVISKTHHMISMRKPAWALGGTIIKRIERAGMTLVDWQVFSIVKQELKEIGLKQGYLPTVGQTPRTVPTPKVRINIQVMQVVFKLAVTIFTIIHIWYRFFYISDNEPVTIALPPHPSHPSDPYEGYPMWVTTNRGVFRCVQGDLANCKFVGLNE